MGEPVAGCVRHRGHPLIDAAVDRAAQILRDGGLVGSRPRTVYGLGADASSREALRRLYAVKGRPPPIRSSSTSLVVAGRRSGPSTCPSWAGGRSPRRSGRGR